MPTAINRKQSTIGSSRNKISTSNSKYKSTEADLVDNRPLPSFENNIITNITTQQGSIAILPCHVRNLGDRSVSN